LFDLNVVINSRAGWIDEWGKYWKSVGQFLHDPCWKPRNYFYISSKWSYKLYWSKIKLQTSPFSARHPCWWMNCCARNCISLWNGHPPLTLLHDTHSSCIQTRNPCTSFQ
jgi:hypothetical protein